MARPCSRKLSISCWKVTPPVTEIALVVGPMDPATKRGLSAVLASSAACRASWVARSVIA